MSGYLNLKPGKLSKMSVNSLTDLGYEVNLDFADKYKLPKKNLRGEIASINDEEGIKLQGCIQESKTPQIESEYVPPR